MRTEQQTTRWSDLSEETQIELREEYSRDPACLSGTCSMDKKIESFSRWLAERDVIFTIDDLPTRSAY